MKMKIKIQMSLMFSKRMSMKNVGEQTYIFTDILYYKEKERGREREQSVGLIRLNWLQKKIHLIYYIHTFVRAHTNTRHECKQS